MPEPDPTQLPHLLALVQDESRVVRDSVLAKLAEFGDRLATELGRLERPPAAMEVEQLQAWIGEYREREHEFHAESAVGVVLGSALFALGDLVRHRRYGYRGVVVARDRSCQASNSWYQRNRSQPDREQPWYHVLVHESNAVTYAAQTSLLADDCVAEIEHPLVGHFFGSFGEGGYQRNDRPWPRHT